MGSEVLAVRNAGWSQEMAPALRLEHYLLQRQYFLGVISGLLFSCLLFEFKYKCNLQPAIRSSLVSEFPTFNGMVKRNRILCWVLTDPANTFKAEMVKRTWGRRCDKLLFMSSQEDASLPSIGLPIGMESRSKLWLKVKLALRYIYDHHINDFDWFFKADDDTYTIVENLRHFLSPLNASLPLFLGRHFLSEDFSFSYYSGGAGYLLTRETLRRFVEVGLNQNACQTKPEEQDEDVNIGRCVGKLGAIFQNSRDHWGRQRFIPYHLDEFFRGKGHNMDFLRTRDGDGLRLGYDCCSNEAITFHYVSGRQMQVYEYLIYKIKVVGATEMK